MMLDLILIKEKAWVRFSGFIDSRNGRIGSGHVQSALVMPVSASQVDCAVEFDHLGWEELGKLAKAAENDIDSKLLTLGRLTSAALRSHRYDGLRAPADSPLRQAERLSEELQTCLTRLATLVDALASRSEEAGSSLHILQRHRDIYSEYAKEFRKTKVSPSDGKLQ